MSKEGGCKSSTKAAVKVENVGYTLGSQSPDLPDENAVDVLISKEYLFGVNSQGPTSQEEHLGPAGHASASSGAVPGFTQPANVPGGERAPSQDSVSSTQACPVWRPHSTTDLEYIQAAALHVARTFGTGESAHAADAPPCFMHNSTGTAAPARARLVRGSSQFYQTIFLDPFLVQSLPKEEPDRTHTLLWLYDMGITESSALIHGFRSTELAGPALSTFRRIEVLWRKREAARARVGRGPFYKPPIEASVQIYQYFCRGWRKGMRGVRLQIPHQSCRVVAAEPRPFAVA